MLMLVVLGGVIAYFADRLGRTLGKKRLSLFGLRPRHTAEVLTVFAGAIIPIVTFAIVMAASADVREWILHSPEYKADRDRAVADLTSARGELQRVQADLGKQQDLLKQINVTVSELKTREAGLQKEVGVKTTQANDAQHRFEQASRQYKASLAQYKVVNGELVVVRKNYMGVRHDYGKVQGQYATLQDSFKNLQALRNEADQQVKNDRQKLDELAKQLTAEQGQLDQTRKDYQATQQDLANAKSELAKTQNDLEVAKTAFGNLYNTSTTALGQSRMNGLIYERGDEITRIEVPARLTEDQARAAVANILKNASLAAASHGAGANQSKESAGLVDISEDMTASKQLDAIVKALTDASEPSAIVANAFYNTFEHEFVPVVINVYNNPVVYHRNQPIAETLVQGALSDGQIFQQISEFVRGPVQTKARQSKMIPVAGKEDSFGQVGAGDILKLVSQIRTVGRAVRLIAYVSQDTHAADPLDLKFQLRM